MLANSPGGLIARRLIVPAIITPLLFGWIAFQGLGLKYYDAGFAASLIVLTSMIVICVLTARSIMELNRIDIERKRLSDARLNADARRSRRAGSLAAQIGVRRQRQPRNPHAR